MDFILSYFAVRPSNCTHVPSHFDLPSFTNLSIAIFCCLDIIFASRSFFLSMSFYAKPSINIRSYLIQFRIFQLISLLKPSLRLLICGIFFSAKARLLSLFRLLPFSVPPPLSNNLRYLPFYIVLLGVLKPLDRLTLFMVLQTLKSYLSARYALTILSKLLT